MIGILILLLFAADKPPETFQSAMEKQRAAAAIQREAVRKQGELAVQWRTPNSAAPPECEAMADLQLTPLIDGAAQGNHVQTNLIRGVIEQESGKRPCAVSSKGAQGLMQLMPATADELQVEDPFDAKQNIEAGAKYLKQLLDRYKGDIKLALAAYNAGPAAVDQAGKIPEIKETQDYVDAIMKKLK